MPKHDPADTAWGRIVATSVRSHAHLRKALKRTIQLGNDADSAHHLRVMVLGPAGSGKSTLIAIVRRLGAAAGVPNDGLEVYEDAIGSPSAARVAWQVVPGDEAERKEITAQMRTTLSNREGPRPELMVIVTKCPEEIVPEISSKVELIDVLTWATNG